MMILTIVSLVVAVAAAVVAILAICENHKLREKQDAQMIIFLQKLRDKQAALEVKGLPLEVEGDTLHVKGNLVTDGYISAGV